MEGVVDLHNYIFFYLILVFVFVFWIFSAIVTDFILGFVDPIDEEDVLRRWDYIPFSKVTHMPVLEIVWTIIPSVILMFIAIPSFTLLYAMDEVIDPAITLKTIGHQWYWSYEYTDDSRFPHRFDSYMIPEASLVEGQLRLLSVDNSVVLPVNTHVRVVVTADDVLHSWAVPSLGLKVDAVPGRLSQLSVYIRREGVYYGQCSELCGVNHGFMPIVVRAVCFDSYLDWLYNIK